MPSLRQMLVKLKITLFEDEDFRGLESEIEDRGSGIGKKNNNNYK